MPPKTTGRGRGKQAVEHEEEELIEALGGLSADEIRRVAACAVLTLGAPGLKQLREKLGKETGGSLGRILEAQRSPAKKVDRPIRSRAKVRGEWEAALADWDACIFESADEDGNYVTQDNDWETPYLDISSLTLDLEPIAARMRRLLKRVFDDDIAPDFSFAELLASAVEQVGAGLPEWMGPEVEIEGLELGPQVTGGLLEWEWLVARWNGENAFHVADRVRAVEVSFEHECLDDETVGKFFLRLGDTEQTSLLEGMNDHRDSPPWAGVLGSVHSGWFKLYQKLLRSRDRPGYLESCRENITKDWEQVLPVLEDLLRRKAYAEALPLVEQGVRGMLSLRETETWDPRADLLIRRDVQGFPDDSDRARVRFLEKWLRLARALEQNEMVCALELQVTIYKKWADGDAALKAFAQVTSRSFGELRDRLFGDWRALVAEESAGHYVRRGEQAEPSWVYALVDAARRGRGGGPVFRRRIREWLEALEHKPATLEPARRILVGLTLEVDPGSRLRTKAPMLHRLLRSEWETGTPLSATRRRWLVQIEASTLLADILQFWKRNAGRLIPDPAGSVKARYEEHAEWLAATRELDTGAYERIVKEWAVRHKRRRNLWEAIAKKGLPVPPA